jgi:hypothetical protein
METQIVRDSPLLCSTSQHEVSAFEQADIPAPFKALAN